MDRLEEEGKALAHATNRLHLLCRDIKEYESKAGKLRYYSNMKK